MRITIEIKPKELVELVELDNLLVNEYDYNNNDDDDCKCKCECKCNYDNNNNDDDDDDCKCECKCDYDYEDELLDLLTDAFVELIEDLSDK